MSIHLLAQQTSFSRRNLPIHKRGSTSLVSSQDNFQIIVKLAISHRIRPGNTFAGNFYGRISDTLIVQFRLMADVDDPKKEDRVEAVEGGEYDNA